MGIKEWYAYYLKLIDLCESTPKLNGIELEINMQPTTVTKSRRSKDISSLI